MASSRAKVNLPASLFDTSGDDETTNDEGAPSRGMRALVAEQEAKRAKRRARPKTIAASLFERTLVEVDEMIRSGEWEAATPRHLVALYDRMHVKCYGIEAEDLDASERYKATMLAGTMLKTRFDGDVIACVEYLRWAWTREMHRERWRRENGKSGGRLGVWLLFSGRLLVDYRLELARRGGSP